MIPCRSNLLSRVESVVNGELFVAGNEEVVKKVDVGAGIVVDSLLPALDVIGGRVVVVGIDEAERSHGSPCRTYNNQ